MPPIEDRQLYSGLIRLHVLHHAAEKPVFGRWLIKEPARHGYTLRAGTLYPLLHAMEKKGYLLSVEERSGKLRRRFYSATPLGKQALKGVRYRSYFPNCSRRNGIALVPKLPVHGCGHELASRVKGASPR